MNLKNPDPLHVLLKYIANVSAACIMPTLHYVTTLILTLTVQRAIECHLALVHDDDLERILEMGDGTVST